VSIASADGESECDLSGLLGMLAQVPDPRNAQGKVYELSFLLAVTLVAKLAGASGFRQIGDQVADLPQWLLAKLGAPWCRFRRKFRCPSEHAIRYAVEQIDAAELDRIVGTWLRSVMRALADGVLGLALDGKVLKGAWTDEHGQFTLFSAMAHREAVTVGQVQVPAGTNEITQVEALLEVVPVLEGEEVVVTTDAAHTQSDTAEYVKGTRGFDYVMTVKGNQCATRRFGTSPSVGGTDSKGGLLGLMADLEPKGEGDKSMPGNRWPGSGAWDGVPGGPRGMAKT
jgi:DDE_Tnp_1-associated